MVVTSVAALCLSRLPRTELLNKLRKDLSLKEEATAQVKEAGEAHVASLHSTLQTGGDQLYGFKALQD